jgi:DNA-binding transcriptional regulator YiaG
VTDPGIPGLRTLADGTEVLSSDQLRKLEHRAVITVLESVEIDGPELRFARKALDLSQGELAERLGVTAETVSRWEQRTSNWPWPLGGSRCRCAWRKRV